MANTNRSTEEINREIAEVNLELARTHLEDARESLAVNKGRREQKARIKQQHQDDLRKSLQERANVIASCTHRQGGSVGKGRERKGKGPSALRVVLMPDDETTLIMCANCPLRVFSPRAIDGNPKVRRGESPEEAKSRVALYKAEKASFDKLLESAQDQITDEAAQPMDCGKTFTFSDRNGERAHVPRPCDSYAQGRDNRQLAEAS